MRDRTDVPFIARIIEIHPEDAYFHSDRLPIGIIVMIMWIGPSVVKGFEKMNVRILENGHHIRSANLIAAKYRRIGVEGTIWELEHNGGGINEYVL